MELDFLKPELLAKILMVLVIVNVSLSALSMVLEKIKDMTSSNVDNVIYKYVSFVAGGLGKLVDFLSANKKHK